LAHPSNKTEELCTIRVTQVQTIRPVRDVHRRRPRGEVTSVSIVKPTRCIKFILFWNDTLHVSDGLSVYHQGFKTVHAATGICQTDTAVCLLARPSETCRVSFQNNISLIHSCI